MLKVNKYIDKDLILVDMKSSNKKEAIEKMLNSVYKLKPLTVGSVTKEKALSAILKRESLQTTGIGEGVAFPHERLDGWKNPAIVVGISNDGIDFDSVDGAPVHFIVLIISSSQDQYFVLQVMAAMIRFLKERSGGAKAFLGLPPVKIYKEFMTYGISATKAVLARDIMRPVKFVVRRNDPLEDAARSMHLNNLDVIPVVDADEHYCGMISCFDIFNYGIPDFFHQLHTVSFVRNIDPFEKYFKIKNSLTVDDVLINIDSSISKDATLMEIVFQLSVKNKPKLFVLDEGRLIGEIDRFSIIDKILFF